MSEEKKEKEKDVFTVEFYIDLLVIATLSAGYGYFIC